MHIYLQVGCDSLNKLLKFVLHWIKMQNPVLLPHQFVFLGKVLKEYDMTHSCKVIISLHLIPYVTRLHAQCMASKAYLNRRGCN